MSRCGNKSLSSDVRVYLTEDELILLVVQALVQARKLKSGMRKSSSGGPVGPQIHIAIQGQGKSQGVVVHSDKDALPTAKSQALGKTKAVLHHSSNGLAMSSRSVGHLVNSGKLAPSEDIVHFAGGVPLYKDKNGSKVLVGSIAISGDVPEVDEAIALAASQGFEAPVEVRSDTLLSVPFSSSVPVEELVVEEVVKSPRVPQSVPQSVPRSVPKVPKSPRSVPKAPGSPTRQVLPPLPTSVSLSALPALPRSPRVPAVPKSPRVPTVPKSPRVPTVPKSPRSVNSLSSLAPRVPTVPKSPRSVNSLSSLAPTRSLGSSPRLPSVPKSPSLAGLRTSSPSVSQLTKL